MRNNINIPNNFSPYSLLLNTSNPIINQNTSSAKTFFYGAISFIGETNFLHDTELLIYNMNTYYKDKDVLIINIIDDIIFAPYIHQVENLKLLFVDTSDFFSKKFINYFKNCNNKMLIIYNFLGKNYQYIKNKFEENNIYFKDIPAINTIGKDISDSDKNNIIKAIKYKISHLDVNLKLNLYLFLTQNKE